MSLSSALKNYATLSRFEFLPAISVAILIGIFLGAPPWGDAWGLSMIMVVIEGLVIFFLLFNTGFIVNCWADWESDEKYKTHLSNAVQTMGRKTVGWIVVAHVVIAILITIHLSMIFTFKPVLLFLVLIGVFLGVGYSVEPFRFKSRGVWHSVMAFPVFAAPGLFSYFLVTDIAFNDLYTQMFLVLVIGITCAHYALVLISQSEDYPEDKEANINTPAVTWGLKKTLRNAVSLNIFGSVLSIMAITIMLYLVEPLAVIGVPLLAGGILSTTWAIGKLSGNVKKARGLKGRLKAIRAVMHNYPKWHAAPLGVIMLFSLILLILRSVNLG
jgi:4-hydroxybenzoate polyprenyltransferase